jgi:hypothetical protein
MKKTVSFLLVLCCISAVISCKKETSQVVNSNNLSTSSTENAVTQSTKFGSLVNGVDGDTRITVSQKFGVGYVRDAVILDSYNGKAPLVDDYMNSGFKVLMNLNYTSRKPSAYPTDMAKYKSLLQKVLNDYTPEVAVIENEPINEGYYKGPVTDYINEIKTAVDVCHSYGVKVSDGGLHTGMVCILVYQDYINRGMQKEATSFSNRALTSQYLKAAQGKGTSDINVKLDKTKQQIDAFKNIALDYVNFHWYQPTTLSPNDNTASQGVVKEIADYLRRATGKQVLCNEFGQYNQSSALITSMVDQLKLAGLTYGIVFSGNSDGGAKSLNNGTKLLSNGIAFRDAVAQ